MIFEIAKICQEAVAKLAALGVAPITTGEIASVTITRLSFAACLQEAKDCQTNPTSSEAPYDDHMFIQTRNGYNVRVQAERER